MRHENPAFSKMGTELLGLVGPILTQHVQPGRNRRPRVVVILPRGEAIRNFVYTGMLRMLSEQAEVFLLAVMPDEGVFEPFRSHFQDLFQLRSVEERWLVRITREILDMAHGRWLWSEAAKERWRLRDAEATNGRQKLKRSIKKIMCRPFASRLGLELLSGVERLTSRLLRNDDAYLSFFSEFKPALVFNGSHVHSKIATQAVQSARWLGIPTAAFVFSWDNLTSQGRIIPPYDHYLVWSEQIRRQLLDIYRSVRDEQVTVTGTPQFDFHFQDEFLWPRELFCKQVGADPSRPIVLYTTGMPNHMPGEPAIIERIAGMLAQMSAAGRPQLLVRVYPKDQSGRFNELKKRR